MEMFSEKALTRRKEKFKRKKLNDHFVNIVYLTMTQWMVITVEWSEEMTQSSIDL